jgi:hypothetical protein
MLDLSEHLKKMVDDERGPCGCDEASWRQVMSVMIERGPSIVQLNYLRVLLRCTGM